MAEPFCYGKYVDGKSSNVVLCDKQNTDECPLQTREFKNLKKEPCCLAIFIPAQFLSDHKGDPKKAAAEYVEICLLE